jgi:hypothetical protein
MTGGEPPVPVHRRRSYEDPRDLLRRGCRPRLSDGLTRRARCHEAAEVMAPCAGKPTDRASPAVRKAHESPRARPVGKSADGVPRSFEHLTNLQQLDLSEIS